jgi:hypothetical protein
MNFLMYIALETRTLSDAVASPLSSNLRHCRQFLASRVDHMLRFPADMATQQWQRSLPCVVLYPLFGLDHTLSTNSARRSSEVTA